MSRLRLAAAAAVAAVLVASAARSVAGASELKGGGAAVRASVGTTVRPERNAPEGGARLRPRSSGALQIFHSSPLIVTPGDLATVLVEVVCITPAGRSCTSSADLSFRTGSGPWTTLTGVGAGRQEFDLGPAVRGLPGRGGFVEFRLSARDTLGRTATLPPPSIGGSARIHLIPELPVVDAPTLRFGAVREGRTVLFMPWGTGPRRAGLALGHEAATVGPSAFDVDHRGRVYVADTMQDRVAVFREGGLVEERPVELSGPSLLAIDHGGTVFVADHRRFQTSVRVVRGVGGARQVASLPGIPARIHPGPAGSEMEIVPLGGWVGLSADGSRPEPAVGRSSASHGHVIRMARETSLRVGRVVRGRLQDAVELRTAARFGDVALVERLGDGYLVVVKTWRESPEPADQYQVIRVAGGRVVETFAVSSQVYSEIPPGARFRLGSDGALYQMTTSPDGVRIVRHELEEVAR